jgi:hypothetical protein
MDGRLSHRLPLILVVGHCACVVLLGTTGCTGFNPPRDVHAEAVAQAGNAPEQWEPTQVAGPIDPTAPAPPPSPYLKTVYAAPKPNGAPQQPISPPQQPGARNAAAETEALQQIMTELQSLGTVDPAVQRQLLADLQQTDPALWPMLMQTFRAGMAYRQKAAVSPATPVASTGPTNPPREPAPQPAAPQISSTPPTPTLPQPSLAATTPQAMLEAATTSINPRGTGTPGLSFPATAMLNAAIAEAQRQESASTQPVPPPDGPAEAKTIQTVAYDKSFATIGTKKDDSPSTANKKPDDTKNGTDEVKSSPETDWQAALTEAVTALESQTRESPTNPQEVTRHAWLRVLYLAAGRRDDALKPIPGIAAAEQDYWTEQLYALSTYLDSEKLSDPARRSAAAAQHLSKATIRLSEASTLAVKNLAFCTEVSSYGVYQKFKSDEFKASQPLILYAEVENFKSEESNKGFHTALRSSYQILDAQGRRVAENDLALTEEFCQNQRRDYFIRYFLSVPERIYAGKYTLQLTIVDTLSQKIGQSTVEFTVTDK